MIKSVLRKISLKIFWSSTSIFPVDEPKKIFKAATSFLSSFFISSKFEFVAPNINE